MGRWGLKEAWGLLVQHNTYAPLNLLKVSEAEAYVVSWERTDRVQLFVWFWRLHVFSFYYKGPFLILLDCKFALHSTTSLGGWQGRAYIEFGDEQSVQHLDQSSWNRSQSGTSLQGLCCKIIQEYCLKDFRILTTGFGEFRVWRSNSEEVSINLILPKAWVWGIFFQRIACFEYCSSMAQNLFTNLQQLQWYAFSFEAFQSGTLSCWMAPFFEADSWRPSDSHFRGIPCHHKIFSSCQVTQKRTNIPGFNKGKGKGGLFPWEDFLHGISCLGNVARQSKGKGQR